MKKKKMTLVGWLRGLSLGIVALIFYGYIIFISLSLPASIGYRERNGLIPILTICILLLVYYVLSLIKTKGETAPKYLKRLLSKDLVIKSVTISLMLICFIVGISANTYVGANSLNITGVVIATALYVPIPAILIGLVIESSLKDKSKKLKV